MNQKFKLSKKIKILILLTLPLIFTQCMFGGGSKVGKVRGYKPGMVLTEKGFYNVGILKKPWQRMHVAFYRVISFYQKGLKSTIETDAFCDGAYDDASLKVLTTHLQMALDSKKTISEKNLMLDNRGALRTVVEGKVDGVPITLDTVVIKKNDCVFDFSLISKPDEYNLVVSDFETFFNGFKYRGDI